MASSFTWTSAQNGNWSTAANWNPQGIPGAANGDTATINATGAASIAYDETAETLNFLTINSAATTLAFNANDALTVNQNTALQAGTINVLNSSAVLNAGYVRQHYKHRCRHDSELQQPHRRRSHGPNRDYHVRAWRVGQSIDRPQWNH